MLDTIFYLALAEIVLTILLAKILLHRLGLRRWISAGFIAGMALPLAAIGAAWAFMVTQPASEQAGAGMLFAMVALLALYALPVCLIASFATAMLSRRKL